MTRDSVKPRLTGSPGPRNFKLNLKVDLKTRRVQPLSGRVSKFVPVSALRLARAAEAT